MPARLRNQTQPWDALEEQTQRIKEPIAEQITDTEKLLHEMEEISKRSMEQSSAVTVRLAELFPQMIVLTFSLMGALIGFSEFFFLDCPFIQLFEQFSPSMVLGVLGLFASVSVYTSMLSRAMARRKDREKNKDEHHLREVTELRKRLQELKQLRSSNFEQIMSLRARQE